VFRTAASALVAFTLALQSYPPAFPRTNATQLLETDRIVVWDIVWPKGQPTAMHRHLHDQVGTYYQRGGRHITNLDGTERTAVTEVGSLSNTRKGTTHIEEGTTDPPLRAVFIELKQEGGSSAAPGTRSEAPGLLPSEAVKNLLDDERVAVWEYASTKSAAPVRGTVARDTIVVWLGEGRLTTARVEGALTVVPIVPGKMEYLPRGIVTIRQVSAGDPRAMVFEIK